MAFQDFDQISERRKAERARKMRKRIIIAVVVVVLLILIAVGAYLLLNKLNSKKGNAKQDKTANSKPAPAKAQPKNDQAKKVPAKGEKIMKQMCGATDYKDKCESIIGKAKDASKPKEFIKTAISAASDEARICLQQIQRAHF